MKAFAVAILFSTGLSAASLQSLAHACVPEADYELIAAIVRTESSGLPWAISINRPEGSAKQRGLTGMLYLAKQPRSSEQAKQWSRRLLADHYTLSVGLMQVSTESGYSVETLLDPCQNLRIGWAIFVQDYRRAGSINAALSLYNSGSTQTGVQNGYVSRVRRFSGNSNLMLR